MALESHLIVALISKEKRCKCHDDDVGRVSRQLEWAKKKSISIETKEERSRGRKRQGRASPLAPCVTVHAPTPKALYHTESQLNVQSERDCRLRAPTDE